MVSLDPLECDWAHLTFVSTDDIRVERAGENAIREEIRAVLSDLPHHWVIFFEREVPQTPGPRGRHPCIVWYRRLLASEDAYIRAIATASHAYTLTEALGVIAVTLPRGQCSYDVLMGTFPRRWRELGRSNPVLAALGQHERGTRMIIVAGPPRPREEAGSVATMLFARVAEWIQLGTRHFG